MEEFGGVAQRDGDGGTGRECIDIDPVSAGCQLFADLCCERSERGQLFPGKDSAIFGMDHRQGVEIHCNGAVGDVIGVG